MVFRFIENGNICLKNQDLGPSFTVSIDKHIIKLSKYSKSERMKHLTHFKFRVIINSEDTNQN